MKSSWWIARSRKQWVTRCAASFGLCASTTFFMCTPGLGETGIWSSTDITAQVNVACTRVYTCGPAEDIMHSADQKIVATPRKLVWGVCSAGTGPPDSCNDCLTNPPTDQCEWYSEKI
jgi:hypothetical protein